MDSEIYDGGAGHAQRAVNGVEGAAHAVVGSAKVIY